MVIVHAGVFKQIISLVLTDLGLEGKSRAYRARLP